MIHSNNVFWLNRQCSRDYGLVSTALNPYACPRRSKDVIQIFGSDTPFVEDNGYYENIVREYEIGAIENLSRQTQRIRDWIMGIDSQLQSGGYTELSDTYNDFHYFRVYNILGMEDFVQKFNRVGTGKLGFLCDPYRYLRESRREIPLENANTRSFNNPTNYTAMPLVWGRVKGDMILTIANPNNTSVIWIQAAHNGFGDNDYWDFKIDCARKTVAINGAPGFYQLTGAFPKFTANSQSTVNVRMSGTAAMLREWREI